MQGFLRYLSLFNDRFSPPRNLTIAAELRQNWDFLSCTEADV